MGGGLAFLNKKTWHPGRFQNQEEVWKREQAAAAEQRKLEELRKQMEDERKHHEMQELAVAAGHKKESDRMDWMYQNGLAAQQDAAKRADEHLLGKPAALAQQQQQAAQELSKCEQATKLPSFMTSATPASQNEAWARLNNDPLLLIKKRQQDQLKAVKENPIKMQQIIQEIQAKQKDKKKSKKSKKEKKEKKSKRSKHGDSSSSSDSEEERRRSGKHAPLPVSMAPPLARGEQRDSGRGYEAARGLGNGRPAEEHHRKRSRSRSRSPGRAREYRSPDGGRDQARRGYDEGRHGMYDRRESKDDRREASGHGGREHEGHDAPRHDRKHSPVRDDRRRSPGRDDRRRSPGRDDRRRSPAPDDRRRSPPRDERDSRPRHDKDSRYGLSHSSIVPEHLRQNDNSQRAAETRARLEEATRKREEEEKAKAAQRHQKREYRTGQLTEEERQKRLAEMMSNASEHEQQRNERLQRAKEADAAADGQIVANAGGVTGREGDAFAKAASKDVFGALTASGGVSLEARINSRKHFNAR